MNEDHTPLSDEQADYLYSLVKGHRVEGPSDTLSDRVYISASIEESLSPSYAMVAAGESDRLKFKESSPDGSLEVEVYEEEGQLIVSIDSPIDELTGFLLDVRLGDCEQIVELASKGDGRGVGGEWILEPSERSSLLPGSILRISYAKQV